MDTTFLIEISSIVAIAFELIKRLIAVKVTDPVVQDYLFRALLVLIALGVAGANYFYFSGHPEITKTAMQITITASGVWAFFIRLFPTKKNDTERETN